MKKILFAASATLAAAVMAPAANASVTVDCPGATSNGAAIGFCSYSSGSTGGFTSSIFTKTAFTDLFYVTTPSFGDLSFTLTNTAALSGITFSSIKLFDSANTFLGDLVTGAAPTTFLGLAADTYKLELIGSTTGAATYSGTIDFTPQPVPEPSTWLMMIAGIAAVGMTMRRRSQAVRVAFS